LRPFPAFPGFLSLLIAQISLDCAQELVAGRVIVARSPPISVASLWT
jgi:hypothetical protein